MTTSDDAAAENQRCPDQSISTVQLEAVRDLLGVIGYSLGKVRQHLIHNEECWQTSNKLERAYHDLNAMVKEELRNRGAINVD